MYYTYVHVRPIVYLDPCVNYVYMYRYANNFTFWGAPVGFPLTNKDTLAFPRSPLVFITTST